MCVGNKRKTPDDQRHGLQKKQRKESDDFLSSFSEEKKDHQVIRATRYLKS